MDGVVVSAIVSLLGYSLLMNNTKAFSPNKQKIDQMYLTSPDTTADASSTTIPISPQTSASPHHITVRHRPAHAYPYNEPKLELDDAGYYYTYEDTPEEPRKQIISTASTPTPGPTPQTSASAHHIRVRHRPTHAYPYNEPILESEDRSYYHTYEDTSEEPWQPITSTASTPTPSPPTQKSARSYWNSQKALLDATRKESAQIFIPTYNKPALPSKDSKPAIEFKVRQRPKFGPLNKNIVSLTTTTKQPEVTTTAPAEVSTKDNVVKSDYKLNLAIQNLAEKNLLKALKESNILPNQIIGLAGEIPSPANQASENQSTLKAQITDINRFGSSRPSKLDSSARNIQNVDQPLQQQNTKNMRNIASLNYVNKAQPFLLNPNQRQSTPPNNNQQTLKSIRSLIQTIKKNRQNANVNISPMNAFIAASAPTGSGKLGHFSLQSTSSSGSGILQMRKTSGIGNEDNDMLMTTAKDRSGEGKIFSLNIPLPNPIALLMQLLQLLLNLLSNLNGRIFFGIKLGSNVGLVGPGGAGKSRLNF